jgi:ABC-type glycerol-3-phosphate transport system substrate-binding protein
MSLLENANIIPELLTAFVAPARAGRKVRRFGHDLRIDPRRRVYGPGNTALRESAGGSNDGGTRMKFVLLGTLLLMTLLSGVAWKWTPAIGHDGRLPIVWATDDNPRRRTQVDLFNQMYPDHELKIDAVNNGIDKVVTQSLAGVGPDVFDAFQDQLGLLWEAGLLYDCTDALAKRGITLDQLWPLSHAAISIDGRIYGMPCNVGGNAIWYHRDILDAAGIPYPPASGWAWDDFVEVARRLTVRDGNGRIERYGVMAIQWYDCIYTSGGRILTADGRRCVIDDPKAIEGLQRWLDLQLKYKVMPSRFEEQTLSTQGGWGSGAITLFQDKRVAMAYGGRWWLCMLRDYKDASGRFPLNLGVAQHPVIRVARRAGGSRVAFVNALSPDRDRAVEFLAFLAGDAYGDQLNRDADALPASIAASTRPAYSFDPNEGRDSGGSPVWRDQMPTLITFDASPYVTPSEVRQLIELQLDLVVLGKKSLEEAATTAARQVNERIDAYLARDPALKARFDASDGSPVLGNFPQDQKGAR